MINLEAIRILAKLVGAVALAIIIFSAGYETAEKKAQLRLQTELTELQTQARNKEQENAKKLAEALAARDKALADAASLRRSAVRVREQSRAVSAKLERVSAEHAASSDSCAVKLGRCEGLLAEGAELLGRGQDLVAEGAELSARVSADKDAALSSR